VVKPLHEVNNGSLSKIGFTKIGGKWVSEEGDQAGSSIRIHAEDGGEEQVTAAAGDDGDDGYQAGQGNEGPDEAFNACPSAKNLDERITSMTPFERLMTSHMDNFAYDQRNHHEFYMARFQNLDEQIEAIQN